MSAPLEGIRVVEAGNWVAAPSTGALMADLGADVIKVEPLKGDVMRNMFRPGRSPHNQNPIDAPFHVDNRGKRSIAVDLEQPKGAAKVRDIIATSQVFITNLLPARQQRFGLDPDTILETNSRVVHATLTGYGTTGPDANRPGFDVTAFFGRGAVIDTMTDPGQVAPYSRPGQGDHVTGLALFGAVLAALRLVDTTGTGQVVEVNLFGTAAWTMATDLSSVLVDMREPTKVDRFHRNSALSNRYQTSDGRWLFVNMPDAAWWSRFCTAIGADALINDHRFDTSKTRRDNMEELVGLLDGIIFLHPLDHWSEVLDEHRLIWGPASTLTELAGDPQAEAIGMFPTITADNETIRTVAAPFRIKDVDVRPRGPGPNIGEHTIEVLDSIGVSHDEIETLVSSQVVGVPRKST
jgi:crotonobetainyl-CoA:carnitine CoA-transferase CaiB-like acyl-CoA transferase